MEEEYLDQQHLLSGQSNKLLKLLMVRCSVREIETVFFSERVLMTRATNLRLQAPPQTWDNLQAIQEIPNVFWPRFCISGIIFTNREGEKTALEKLSMHLFCVNIHVFVCLLTGEATAM